MAERERERERKDSRGEGAGGGGGGGGGGGERGRAMPASVTQRRRKKIPKHQALMERGEGGREERGETDARESTRARGQSCQGAERK